MFPLSHVEKNEISELINFSNVPLPESGSEITIIIIIIIMIIIIIFILELCQSL